MRKKPNKDNKLSSLQKARAKDCKKDKEIF